MSSKSSVVWSIKELTGEMRKRQLNKFDVNFGVSGKRGNGKSTVIFKIFRTWRKEGFRQKKHQVYSQDDVIELLSTQEFGFCWDDEAINSGYKRDFQKTGQKILIKIITNYRDNFNVYASALPFFYSLDKDLRELLFMHIHVIERGVAVILMPLEDQIHESDPWDTKYNQKIEAQENKRIQENPKLKFRYDRFSTFAGYLFFGPMTKKQEAFYKAIKKKKRSSEFQDSIKKKDDNRDLGQKLYSLLMEGKLSKEGIEQACLLHGKKYTSMCQELNRMIKNSGDKETLMKKLEKYAQSRQKEVNNKVLGSINDLVPSL